MNTMTLDEMKLAVCEKLPGVVKIKYHLVRGGGSVFYPHFYWFIKNRADEFYRDTINWPTEGLQVCHEAEKLLTEDEVRVYLFKIHPRSTYEQRLEALCQVWFPERFEN